MTGRFRRGAATSVAVVLLSGSATALTSSGPAAADTIANARARAAALAATVSRLQTQAEVATERYDAVEAELGQAVIRQSLAERQAEADQASVDVASAQITDRVRAFYESGGQVTLLATVLDGSDPTDAMTRMHLVGSLLSANESDVSAAAAITAKATQLAASLTSAASRVTQLQKQAAAAAMRVQTLLATQRKALAAATSDVRRLVAQQ
ncbi:MAG: hypothetical protein JO222_11475, partial [Frankiales bacterium]|nr:hypothetical protein [Frankiales bacterium]